MSLFSARRRQHKKRVKAKREGLKPKRKRLVRDRLGEAAFIPLVPLELISARAFARRRSLDAWWWSIEQQRAAKERRRKFWEKLRVRLGHQDLRNGDAARMHHRVMQPAKEAVARYRRLHNKPIGRRRYAPGEERSIA